MASLTLMDLRAVVAVADGGSFTAAAGALGYTQSAVSRQIAAAERAVGAPLFTRGPRGVALTAPGARLVRHARAILERVDVAVAEAGADADAPTLEGRVRLGAFATALAVLVPRSIVALGREHPAVSVQVREGGSEAQLRRLRAGQIDVAIISAGAGLSWDLQGLRHRPLLRGQAHVAVPADHPAAARGWINVADLTGERWVVGEAGRDGPQFGVWPGMVSEPEIAWVMRDWLGRLGLVAAGLGIATIPSLLLGALPPGVAAVRVEDPQPFRREVLAVIGPTPSPPRDALLGALAEVAADLTPTGRDGDRRRDTPQPNQPSAAAPPTPAQ